MADDGDTTTTTTTKNRAKPSSGRPPQETFHRAQETQVELKFPNDSAGIVPLPPGSRGPKSLYLKRNGDSFGFTLRHFIVYPPDSVAENDGRHAAVGALSAPMETIFVKHVRERSAAQLAGLKCGDRLVGVNRIPVTDKSYHQVVKLIQNSPDYLHLLVVPKEDDVLQRYFADAAYNPASNQRHLEVPTDRQSAQRFLAHAFGHQRPGEFKVDAISWRSLQNSYGYGFPDHHTPIRQSYRGQRSADNLLSTREDQQNPISNNNRPNRALPPQPVSQEIYAEIHHPHEFAGGRRQTNNRAAAQPQVPLYRKMGRRASDGCALSDRREIHLQHQHHSNSSDMKCDPDDSNMVVNNSKQRATYKANHLAAEPPLSPSFNQEQYSMTALRSYPNTAGCRLSLDAGRRESSSSLSSSYADGSKDSLNSFDSTSTLTGHETDDSAIMSRYRRSFQQKAEFLSMPVTVSPVDATLIQREFYGRPKKLDKAMWPPNEGVPAIYVTVRQESPPRNVAGKPTHQNFQRVKNDIEVERDMQLQSLNITSVPQQKGASAATKNNKSSPSTSSGAGDIRETLQAPSSFANQTEQINGSNAGLEDDLLMDDKRMYPPHIQMMVHHRAKQFESGKPLPEDDPLLSDRTSFYRSELARLSSKRVVPNVPERAQEFEIRSSESKKDFSSLPVTVNTTTGTASANVTIAPSKKKQQIQRDARSLESSGSNTSLSSVSDVLHQLPNKKLSGNVIISTGSKYIHCPPPSEYGKPTDTSEYEAIKVRARCNSAESWVAALQNDKKTENKRFSRQDAVSEDGGKDKDHHAVMDLSAAQQHQRPISNNKTYQKQPSSPLIPVSVEHMQLLAPSVSVTPAATESISTPPITKAVRPTQLDLDGPIRPARHLKPPTALVDTPIRRSLSPGIGEDKPVVVKRRNKNTNLADDERTVRRESYLKATDSGRVHFDSDLSDGDISPHMLRSGSVSGNSSSSASLDREKNNASPLLEKEKHVIIKEGPLHCKITEIDGKRFGDRSWKQIWALLKGPKLFLLKDKHHQSPIGTSADALEHSLASGVDMRTSLPRVAEDYTKRKHVLRVSSVKPCRSEFLLQADNPEELVDWVKALQEQMATTTDVEARLDPSNLSKQQAVPQTIPASTSIQVQGSSRLSPQLPGGGGAATGGKSKYSSTRNRSPTGQSPVSKTRKPPSSHQVHNEPATSPKSKTWRGRVAKQFRKMQGASSPSSPTAPEGSTFGIPLDQCIASNSDPFVPRFVEVCTEIVDARGLQTVGIYRVPGNNASITALTEEVNRNYDEVPLDDPKWNDVHVVSSLLKSYFRKMPDSLVTNALCPSFIKADKIEDAELRMRELKKLIKSLPPHNYHTLKHVILHLKKVVDNSDTNRMEAKNLAIVFGPTIVKPEEDSMENMVNNMTHQCKIVETLLTCADWFFGDDDCERIPIPLGLADVHEEIEPMGNQMLLLDNISKYEALKKEEKNGALFSSIISAAQRVKRKATKGGHGSLNESKEEVGSPSGFTSGKTFLTSATDLKESTTTTDGKMTNVIPTTVTEMEKIDKLKNEKNPWFNYSTDQEEFHKRIENFEQETKAMLRMPRNVEISITNISSRPNSLSSSASNVNQNAKLSTKSEHHPDAQLLKTHSASNVFNRLSNTPDYGNNSIIINRNSDAASWTENTSTAVQYNGNKSEKNGAALAAKTRKSSGDCDAFMQSRHYINAARDQYFSMDSNRNIDNGNVSIVGAANNKNTSAKGGATNTSASASGGSMAENKCNGRFVMRRGSSVENLNSSSMDLNANSGTMKKLKFENEGDAGQRTGSLDSLNKIGPIDDGIDLVASLTKIYDEKLMEEKHSSSHHSSLLAGEGLPYVDESPETVPLKSNHSNRRTLPSTFILKEKSTVPDELTMNDLLYRNPSLHKNSQYNNKDNNSKELKNKRDVEEKDEDSTLTPLNRTPSISRVVPENDRHQPVVNKLTLICTNSNRISSNGGSKLKRSESLNKPERTTSPHNTKVKRSESLNKTNGSGCNADRLKRSDSLTKTEKTESNLNKRREMAASNRQRSKDVASKLKRKNGMPDRSIKRRHTVGGTKDPDKVTWLDNKYQEDITASNKENKDRNLRTSSPDLSSSRRERLFFEIIGPENMVLTLRQHFIGTRPQSFPESSVFSVPLESQV